MLESIENIKGLEIYAPNGIFVGTADQVIIDVDDRNTVGIIVADPNPVFADRNVSITIPYRWVQAVGDIIILKVFPKFIRSDGTVED